MLKYMAAHGRSDVVPVVPLFEPLEPRLLLDGNVTAFVAGGNLFIYGDAGDNDIIVEQGVTNPGEFSIKGRLATGTTVNGTAEDTPVGFPGVTAGIWAWLAGGNDAVKLNDIAVPGTVWLDHGAGDSTTDVDPTTIGGNLWVWTGPAWTAASDSDIVDIETCIFVDPDEGPSTFTGPVNVYTGAGDDVMTVGAGVFLETNRAHFSVTTWDGGPGNDLVSYEYFGNTGTITPLNWENHAPVIWPDQTIPAPMVMIGWGVGHVMADDPEDGTDLTYTVLEMRDPVSSTDWYGTGSEPFSLDPDTAELTIIRALPAPGMLGDWRLLVQVEDSAGGTYVETVIVTAM